MRVAASREETPALKSIGQTPEAGRAPVEWAAWMRPASLVEHLFGTGASAISAASPRLHGTVVDDIDAAVTDGQLARTEILITGWGIPPLTDAILASAPRLRHILHAGGQASSVIPKSAWDRGIRIANAGLSNAVPVAEYTVAMIVLANKEAFTANRVYRLDRRRIDREERFPHAGNAGRTVGIVGASRIGQMVLSRLRGFDLTVLVYDPIVPPDAITALGAQSVPLDRLLAESDVVSLHPPLTASTQGMIGARELALLRNGATLINTSRGAIVDQDALTAELRSGRLSAILDVTEPDVLPVGDALYDLENVFLTPHIAGSMGTEIGRIGSQLVDEMRRILAGSEPLHLEPRP